MEHIKIRNASIKYMEPHITAKHEETLINRERSDVQSFNFAPWSIQLHRNGIGIQKLYEMYHTTSEMLGHLHCLDLDVHNIIL